LKEHSAPAQEFNRNDLPAASHVGRRDR